MRRLFILLILTATIAMGGCSLSRARIQQADAVITLTVDRQNTCRTADHCAMPSPLADAAREANAASTADKPVHVATLLEDGEAC